MRSGRISDASAGGLPGESAPAKAHLYTGENSSEASATLGAYYAESWFTAEGARLKERRLHRAGIPDLTNWRFITLTVADRTADPLTVYERGKERMRRFFARFRQAVGGFRWCWKLEFHGDDYPHWHVCVEYKNRIPQEMLDEVERWWGLGRIKVQRINRRDMYYLFKYVSKAPEDLPLWVQKYRGMLRVFQASSGFYLNPKKRTAKKAEPRSCRVPWTLETRQSWDAQRGILTTWHNGQARKQGVRLRMTFARLILSRALQAIRTGVPMDYPDRVNVSPSQVIDLKYEQRKFAGLGRIPQSAGFDAYPCRLDLEPAPDWRAVSVGHGDFCPARG